MKKFVLLTGASGGLGYAATVQLSRAGFNVFACDLKAEQDEKLLNLAKKSKTRKDNSGSEYKGQVLPLNIDVTSDEAIENCKKIVKLTTKELYAIVNLAGIFRMDSLLEGDEKIFKKVMDVNFWGTYKINKAFFELLKQDVSKIINMSSETAGYSVPPFNGFYAVSKHALDNYNDGLRREYAYLGIKVIKIRAGSFKTGMMKDTQQQFDVAKNKSEYYKEQFSIMQKSMARELNKENSPYKLGDLIVKILNSQTPKIVYKITNSFQLKLLSLMPEKLRDNIYLKSLSKKQEKKETNK